MGKNTERNIYRVVLVTVLVIGALWFMWALTQGDFGLGSDGIFQFLPDPAPTQPAPPVEAP